mgnify:CR=1 FL=1
MKRFTLSLAAALLASTPGFAQQPETDSFRERGVEDEVIYFVLPDRFANGDTTNDLGGYADDPLVSGLRALGHVVSISAQSSGIGTILRVQRNGQAQLEGGADPRREGLVLGDTVR